MDSLVDQKYISQLWNELSGNPSNRCLAIGRVVGNHGDHELKQFTLQKIKQSFVSEEVKSEAITLLRLDAPLPNLQKLIVQNIAKPLPIRVEPELGRLAIALKLAAPFRFWCILRELTRKEQGSGQVRRGALRTALTKYNVEITNDHFSRIIRDGEGVFWDIDRYQENLYVRSPQRVAPILTEIALRISPKLIETNPPGVRDMYINVSGSRAVFEAALYAGWMAYREAPTISRKVLASLFGRDEDTLRRWGANPTSRHPDRQAKLHPISC